VMSFMVAQRTREFGIRIALGATGQDLVRNVIGRGVGLTTLGVALGLAAAGLLTKAIGAMLYATNPLDVPSFMVAAIVLVGAAAMAAWLPARRASRVDPVAAMRAD
jgi:putative ABC transport system permease protein